MNATYTRTKMTHNELFWTTVGLLIAFIGTFILMVILAVKGCQLQEKNEKILNELKKLKERQ